MTDRGPLYDQNETPEDVATLYSWANLHGAKYRDFSASRAQTREKARLRVQQAIDEEQARAQQLAGAEKPVEIQNIADVERAAEMRRLAEQARAAEQARNEELAAQQAAREAAQQAAREAADKAARKPAKRRPARRQSRRHAKLLLKLKGRRQKPQRVRQRRKRRNERQKRQRVKRRRKRRNERRKLQLVRRRRKRGASEQAEAAERQAAQEAAQRAADEMARRAAQLAEQQAQEKAAQLAAEKAAEQAARAAAEKAAQQLAEQKLAAQRAAQEAQLQATRLAAEKAAQQLAAQRAALQAQAAKDAAQRVAEEAARQAEQQAARQAAEQAAQQRAAQLAADQGAREAEERAVQEAALRTAQEAALRTAQEAAQREAQEQAQADRLSAAQAAEAAQAEAQPAAPYYSPKRDYSGRDFASYVPPPAHAPAQSQPQASAPREDSYPLPRNPWATADQNEHAGRPAWLMPDRAEVAPPQPVPQVPEDTLQGSRDRLASRWYALRGVFEGVGAPAEAVPTPVAARAPVVAIFSLAGGVGKTSLVATLGRALSARGERVLLVDTAPYGLLPFFFGARDQRPGLLRTFSPPGNSGDAPIQMVTIDPEGLGSDAANQDALSGEITTYSRGASRVIVDLATASGATTRRVLRLAPLVVVPLVPDMNSVVSFSSIDSFFQHNGTAQAKPPLPFYVLNQFDPSLPLHLDIREVLREQLGDRLLPFVLRRTPVVSEALAEGMTVMDYAPNSTVAEDFGSLAGWVKSQSAAASSTYRGVRWSER